MGFVRGMGGMGHLSMSAAEADMTMLLLWFFDTSEMGRLAMKPPSPSFRLIAMTDKSAYLYKGGLSSVG